MKKYLVTLKELAEAFGKDDRTIQVWVTKGMPKVERGMYDLAACLRWKTRQLEEEIDVLEQSGDKTLHAQRIYEMEMKNKERELKLRKMAGELIEKKDLTIAWVNEVRNFARHMKNMPERIVRMQEDKQLSRDELKKNIERVVREVMSEMSKDLHVVTDEEDVTALSSDDEGGDE